jgi:hypothetical protein
MGNSWTHDKGSFDPVHSLKMAKEAIAVLEIPQKHAAIPPGHGWRPPDGNAIKINTDGGLATEVRKGGGGGVARSASSFVAAWCKPYEDITNPLIAEVLALRDGVIFAQLRGYSDVVMEIDCLEIVNLWNSRRDCLSVVAPVLHEIGELVPSFNSFVIQHIPRSANLPAHLCAKLACNLLVTDSWIDCIPDFLVISLLADQSGSVLAE